MNFYTYIKEDLIKRGWYLGANGQSVFYHHDSKDLLIEPLPGGFLNVLNLNYEEVQLIEPDDNFYTNLDKL